MIDRSSAQVPRGDRRIDLTPTEFKLLAFLAQHPGQVFSRGQLLQNVWGYSADLFDERTVNVPSGDSGRRSSWTRPSRRSCSRCPAWAIGWRATRWPSRDPPLGLRSLRWRLSVGFAAIAVLTALVIGVVLVPSSRATMGRPRRTYLEAAAERAVRDLSTATWNDPAEMPVSGAGAFARHAGAGHSHGAGRRRRRRGRPAAGGPAAASDVQPLVDPLGAGLLGEDLGRRVAPPLGQVGPAAGARDGQLLGYVEISHAPAYAGEALATVMRAWGLASLLGVLLAAIVGSSSAPGSVAPACPHRGQRPHGARRPDRSAQTWNGATRWAGSPRRSTRWRRASRRRSRRCDASSRTRRTRSGRR